MNFWTRGSFRAGLVVAAVGIAAYANTFRVPFTFDDIASIVDNPSIRRLFHWREVLAPPGGWGRTVSGRPILNLSLTLNYAISGVEIWSYHLLNLAIHLLAGLTVYGIVRRTLTRPLLAGRFGQEARPLALLIALLWTAHPLQSEAVTYVIQRAESLMGLFFLLTLYGFIRAVDSDRPRGWWSLMVAAGFLGVATKEVAAMAPVIVFLYDRTFVSGSFGTAWREHRGPYLALAASWLLLLGLLATTGGDRGGTFRFDSARVWVDYGLTQFEALTRYGTLSFWPHPLVFDYGKIAAPGFASALAWALPVLAGGAASGFAWRRWPAAGFLGAWFFGILAPTSLAPGALQMIVEHRMYLPLAAIITFLVCAGSSALGTRRTIAIGSLLLPAATLMTLERNGVYRSEKSLWEDTVAQRPANARAQNNLGSAYYRLGRVDDALRRYRESLLLDPSEANTHYNLGLALMRTGRLAEAARAFAEAVRIVPYYYPAHLNLGVALMKLGRSEEAFDHFAAAIRFDRSPVEAHFRFGVALAERGRWREAAEHYAEAVRLDPSYAEAQSNWGVALLQDNASAAALEHFAAALQLDPRSADVHFNLGLALASLGRGAEATAHYAEAVRLNPKHADAQLNLGVAPGQSGRLSEAIKHLEQAVRLRPDWPQAQSSLGTAYAENGRLAEALTQYEFVLRLRPEEAQAHYNVGYALLALGRRSAARAELTRALELQPTLTAARDLLRHLPATDSEGP